MSEVKNDKLKTVVGGSGVANGGFQIGDWVEPKRMRMSPQGLPSYYRIDDIEDPGSHMPKYVVNTYVKYPLDGHIEKRNHLGTFLAEELSYGHDPTVFDTLINS